MTVSIVGDISRLQCARSMACLTDIVLAQRIQCPRKVRVLTTCLRMSSIDPKSRSKSHGRYSLLDERPLDDCIVRMRRAGMFGESAKRTCSLNVPDCDTVDHIASCYSGCQDWRIVMCKCSAGDSYNETTLGWYNGILVIVSFVHQGIYHVGQRTSMN